MITLVEMKEAWEKEFIRQKLEGAGECIFLPETVQDCTADLSRTEILSVFVNSRVDTGIFERMPRLKMIATRSTGYDHIDLQTAKARGVSVCTVPTYGENTVAEHTFALILSLSRNLRKAYLRTVQNDFSIDGLMGFDLKGKTLGVVGTGHIGIHVIRMALGFGMRVVAYDVKEQSFLAEILGFEYVPFETLLESSDIISLHAPYLPSTRHLINRKNIARIKKGAVLVNTARGGLIETDALVEALDRKILNGAGLDVLEEEEYLLEEKRLLESGQTEEHWRKLQTTLKNHVLLHRENVIYTPHMAFFSREAVERILATTAENILGFQKNSPVHTVCAK